MDLISRLFRFYFIDFHKNYFRLMYRLTVLLSHQFGMRIMVVSLFKPLFGFPGILSRINGVVIRSLSITLGSIILTIFMALSLAGYFLIVAFPLLFLDRPFIAIVSVLLALFIRTFTYLNDPEWQIEQILQKAVRKDFRPLVHRLEKSKKIKEFINRAELDYDKSINLMHETVVSEPQEFVNSVSSLIDEELFVRYIENNPELKQFLRESSAEDSRLHSTLEFTKQIQSHDPNVWEDEYNLPPSGGIDKGWAVGYTGVLNQHSDDLTKLALKGLMPKLIGRDKTKSEVITILSKPSKNNVMILGESGSGKTTFVKALAREIALGTEIPSLKNKRVVSLNIGKLTSGSPGEINNRMSKIVAEIQSAGNIVLFVDEIHNLSSTLSNDPNASSVLGALEPYLSSGKFQFIGTTSQRNYAKYIQPNTSFASAFDNVDLPEASEIETVKIIAELSKDIEHNDKHALVTYGAVKESIDLSDRYIYQRSMPDKAIELLNQAVAKSVRSGDSIVSGEDVRVVISDLKNVPVQKLQTDEREILMNLEDILHQRVVGQKAAIHAISKALKRARAGVRNEDRPIASFMFIGPTGVGKTETAKTLAESYYGDEDSMIRIDMSEYQTRDSISRFIGTESTPGVLPMKVNTNPHSLILLDEIEKADPNILNLFLQVLDEGRLTTVLDEVIDFTNTFIIMTSNVGTREVVQSIESGKQEQEVRQVAMEKLKEHFPPEFLNRFTDIIPYSPLSEQDIQAITKIKLNKLKDKMKQKQIEIEFAEEIVVQLAKEGTSNEWGARHLNRLIEDKVETKIADMLISEEIKPGDKFTMATL